MARWMWVARLAGPALVALAALVVQDMVPGQMPQAVVASLGWLALAWFGARLFDLAVVRSSAAEQRPQVPRLLGDIARVVLFSMAAVAVIATLFGRSGVGVLATSGVLVAVLGFALRNMIADIFSGVALGVEHPYRLGDWVEVEPGLVGQVVEINWRATRLITRDEVSVIVPNGLIAASRFLNYSYPERHYRAALPVTLDVSVPVERARRVLLSGALRAHGVLSEPAPEVVVDTISERGVTYLVRYWVPDFRNDIPCRDAVGEAVLRSLALAGLTPAEPRQRVRLMRGRDGDGQHLACAELLPRLGLFQDFVGEELAALAEGAREHQLRPGQVVVRQGEPGQSLFVVAEGLLEVTRQAEAGPVLRLGRMGTGEVFGEMSLLTGQPRSATVTAFTEAVVYEIDKCQLDPILRRRPDLAQSLAAVMAERQARNRDHDRSMTEGEAVAVAVAADPAQDLLARVRKFFGL